MFIIGKLVLLFIFFKWCERLLINLPTEGGKSGLIGLFSSKKREIVQTANETKREQEIDLLMKTIKFAPFSELGIKSAKRLMKNYDLTDIDI